MTHAIQKLTDLGAELAYCKSCNNYSVLSYDTCHLCKNDLFTLTDTWQSLSLKERQNYHNSKKKKYKFRLNSKA